MPIRDIEHLPIPELVCAMPVFTPTNVINTANAFDHTLLARTPTIEIPRPMA
jgi:hypothetical protein